MPDQVRHDQELWPVRSDSVMIALDAVGPDFVATWLNDRARRLAAGTTNKAEAVATLCRARDLVLSTIPEEDRPRLGSFGVRSGTAG